MRFRKVGGRLLYAFLIVLAAATGPVYGQGEPSKLPQLGEHVYMPNTLVRLPFIRTEISNSTGAGLAPTVDLEPLQIGNEEISIHSGDLIFVSVGFGYQHAVKSWLSLGVEVAVSTRMGKKTEGLLTQGVTSVASSRLGWGIKLLKTDNIMLTGLLDLSSSEARLVNVLDFARDIIENGFTDETSLSRKFTSLRGSGGLAFAWGISAFAGLYASAQTAYGEALDQENTNKWSWRVNAALDLDLSAKTPIPLSVAAGYDEDSSASVAIDLSDNIRSLMFRVGYLTPSGFNLGLENRTTWIPLKLEQGKTTFTLSTMFINLRYYF